MFSNLFQISYPFVEKLHTLMEFSQPELGMVLMGLHLLFHQNLHLHSVCWMLMHWGQAGGRTESLGLGLGLGGTGRELGAHRARVSASTDSRLLKVGSESSSAGRWFYSCMVLFTNECLISSVLPDRSRNLWRCDALVLESAPCSPNRSGVTATSPCTILYMRARRWDFRRCSNVCHLRSLASWETLTCSRGLFPHTQRTALFCIFCNASWSFFQCGSHIVAAYSALDLTRLK